MMKKTTLFITLILLSFGGKAQSVKQIEDKMYRYTKSIDKWGEDDEEFYDSLKKDNKDLLNYMVRKLTKAPATLLYDFPKLKKSRIDILTSDDNKFRIYCWAIGYNSTAQSFDALLQYKSDSGTKIKILNDDSKGVEGDVYTGAYYKALFTKATKTRGNIYLVISNEVASGAMGVIILKAYSVENGKLCDTVRLFKTTKKTLNSFSFYYDLSNPATKDTIASTSLSEDKMRLKIPVVVENGLITDKYIVYKFDGDYFVFDKNEK